MIIESILQTIKKSGGRITKVRQAVVEILSSAHKPVSTVELTQKLKKKKIVADRTTVYREIIFLVSNNIIRRVQLENDVKYYEVVGEHHHHLVCTSCHSITEIMLDDHMEEQKRKIWKKEKFKVVEHALEFFGLCTRCL